MRTTVWIVGLVVLVGCQRNRARDCVPYAYDPVIDLCVCPEGTVRSDGGATLCVEYDGGAPISCAGGAAPIPVYADADADGHGSPETERMGCPGEPGTSMLGDDCDDACATCHPGGTEICDGEDNDCASGPDDTFACVQGTTTACTTSCSTPGTGACSAECTMPAACTPPSETCNELDDDCDDLVDEGVIALADRIEYPIAGEPLAIVASTPELAMISHDSRGIHLQRFGSDGTPVASHIAAMAGDFSAAAANASGADRALVAGIARSTGAITIAEIDLRTGDVTEGPRNIGTRSGGGVVQIRVVSAGLPVVVYNSGSQILARGGTWTGGFAERVVASGVEGFARFDAIADPAALSSAYVAFAAYPDGGTANSEILVQRISGFGDPQGVPHRVTTNSLRDVDPVLSSAGTDLNIVWFQGAGIGVVTGVARVQVVSPRARRQSPRRTCSAGCVSPDAAPA